MEAVGSAAAVIQILGHSIQLWQEIQEVRQHVRNSHKALADLEQRVRSVEKMVRQVESQPALHTAPIEDELARIYKISKEMDKLLQRMVRLQKRSPVKQYIHGFSTGKRDAEGLKAMLVELYRAKEDLHFQMNLVNLGYSSSHHRFVTADEKESGWLLSLGRESFGEPGSPDAMGQGWESAASLRPTHASVYGNTAFDEADQMNAVVSSDRLPRPLIAEVRGNISRGKAKQRNLVFADAQAASMMEPLYG